MNERKQWEPVTTIVVYGEAVSQGSKDAFVPTYGNGKPVRRHRPSCPGSFDKDTAREVNCGCPILATLKESSPGLDTWRETVGWTARQQYKGPVLDGPLAVEIVFFRPRPQGDFGTGRNAGVLKDSARAYPTTMPDLDKLERAIGDALTKVLWRDDSLIVRKFSGKDYVRPGESARVEIRVWKLVEQTVGDLVIAGIVEPPRPKELHEQLSLVA